MIFSHFYQFSHTIFPHIYMDMNMIVDGLSKDGTRLDRETWLVLQQQEEIISKYACAPWF